MVLLGRRELLEALAELDEELKILPIICSTMGLSNTRVHRMAQCPSWVNCESYFLSECWFVSGMPSLHANALVHDKIRSPVAASS